jgi:hypothetical protein
VGRGYYSTQAIEVCVEFREHARTAAARQAHLARHQARERHATCHRFAQRLRSLRERQSLPCQPVRWQRPGHVHTIRYESLLHGARRHATFSLEVARLAADVARLLTVRALGYRVFTRAARVALSRLGACAGQVTGGAAIVACLRNTGVRRSPCAAAATIARLSSAPAGLLLLDLRSRRDWAAAVIQTYPGWCIDQRQSCPGPQSRQAARRTMSSSDISSMLAMGSCAAAPRCPRGSA